MRVFAARGHGVIIDSQKTALSKALKWLIPMARMQILVIKNDHSQSNCIYIPQNA